MSIENNKVSLLTVNKKIDSSNCYLEIQKWYTGNTENLFIFQAFRFLSMLRCLPYAHYKHNSASTIGKNAVTSGQNMIFIAINYEESM